jgi:hypothetical protein
MSFHGLVDIPTLDIENLSESLLVSNVGSTHGIPAPSPTIVDPEMYPFPSTPGLLGSQHEAGPTTTTYGSPIWSPMHSAQPAPPPIPSALHHGQHQLGPPLSMMGGSQQQGASVQRSPPVRPSVGSRQKQPPHPPRRVQGASFPPFRLSSPFSGADVSESAFVSGSEVLGTAQVVVNTGGRSDLWDDRTTGREFEQQELGRIYNQDHQDQLYNLNQLHEHRQQPLDHQQHNESLQYGHQELIYHHDRQSQHDQRHQDVHSQQELCQFQLQQQQQRHGSGRPQFPQPQLSLTDQERSLGLNVTYRPEADWRLGPSSGEGHRPSPSLTYSQFEENSFENLDTTHGPEESLLSRSLAQGMSISEVEFQRQRARLHASQNERQASSTSGGALENQVDEGSTTESGSMNFGAIESSRDDEISASHSIASLFPRLTAVVAGQTSSSGATGNPAGGAHDHEPARAH